MNSMSFMLVLMGLDLIGTTSTFSSLESEGESDRVNLTGEREGNTNLLRLNMAGMSGEGEEMRNNRERRERRFI